VFLLPGKYLASINLCGSILARSVRQKRSRLLTQDKSAQRRKGAVELEKFPTAGPPPSGIVTAPSAWEADDTLTFDSILGNSAAKRALFEHVVLPLKLSDEARTTIFGKRFDICTPWFVFRSCNQMTALSTTGGWVSSLYEAGGRNPLGNNEGPAFNLSRSVPEIFN